MPSTAAAVSPAPVTSKTSTGRAGRWWQPSPVATLMPPAPWVITSAPNSSSVHSATARSPSSPSLRHSPVAAANSRSFGFSTLAPA